MTTEIVIDRHGLINKVDFVRALAVRHLAESRKFHPDATEEHRKWREMKNACKQLAAAYLKTLRTAADANMYLDQLHLIMYENNIEQTVLQNMPPTDYVNASVSGGVVQQPGVLNIPLMSDGSPFPLLPMSEKDHGALATENKRLRVDNSNMVTAVGHYLDKLPVPLDDEATQLDRVRVESMNRLIQGGSQPHGSRVLRSMNPGGKKNNKYFSVSDGHEKDLRVIAAGRMGKGVISSKEIMSGEYVVEYKGDLITKKWEANMRRIALTATGKESYLMMIHSKNGKKNWVDASNPMCGKARFINHLKSGYNLYGKIMYDKNDMPHVALFSCRHIRRGDFLYYNYGGYFSKELEPWANDTLEGLPPDLVNRESALAEDTDGIPPQDLLIVQMDDEEDNGVREDQQRAQGGEDEMTAEEERTTSVNENSTTGIEAVLEQETNEDMVSSQMRRSEQADSSVQQLSLSAQQNAAPNLLEVNSDRTSTAVLQAAVNVNPQGSQKKRKIQRTARASGAQRFHPAFSQAAREAREADYVTLPSMEGKERASDEVDEEIDSNERVHDQSLFVASEEIVVVQEPTEEDQEMAGEESASAVVLDSSEVLESEEPVQDGQEMAGDESASEVVLDQQIHEQISSLFKKSTVTTGEIGSAQEEGVEETSSIELNRPRCRRQKAALASSSSSEDSHSDDDTDGEVDVTGHRENSGSNKPGSELSDADDEGPNVDNVADVSGGLDSSNSEDPSENGDGTSSDSSEERSDGDNSEKAPVSLAKDLFASPDTMKDWKPNKYLFLLDKVTRRRPGVRKFEKMEFSPATDENIRNFTRSALQEPFMIETMKTDMAIFNKPIDYEEGEWYSTPSSFGLCKEKGVMQPSAKVIPRPSRVLTPSMPVKKWSGQSLDITTLSPDYWVAVGLPAGEDEPIPVVRITPDNAKVQFLMRVDDLQEIAEHVKIHLISNLKHWREKKCFPKAGAAYSWDGGKARVQYYMNLVTRSIFPDETVRSMAPVVTSADFNRANFWPFCYYRAQVVGTQLLPAIHKVVMRRLEERGKYSDEELSALREEFVLDADEFYNLFNRWARTNQEQFFRDFFHKVCDVKRAKGTLKDDDHHFLTAFRRRTIARPEFHRGESLLTCAGIVSRQFFIWAEGNIPHHPDCDVGLTGYGNYQLSQGRSHLHKESPEVRQKRLLRKLARVDHVRMNKKPRDEKEEKTKKKKGKGKKTKKAKDGETFDGDGEEDYDEAASDLDVDGGNDDKTPEIPQGTRKSARVATLRSAGKGKRISEKEDQSTPISRRKTSRSVRKKNDEEATESEPEEQEPKKRSKKSKGKKKVRDSNPEDDDDAADSSSSSEMDPSEVFSTANMSALKKFFSAFSSFTKHLNKKSTDGNGGESSKRSGHKK